METVGLILEHQFGFRQASTMFKIDQSSAVYVDYQKLLADHHHPQNHLLIVRLNPEEIKNFHFKAQIVIFEEKSPK